MRLRIIAFAAFVAASPAAGQSADSPPAAVSQSGPQDVPSLDLPVSLDNIRDGLARPPALRGLDRKPDFSVTIEEQQRLEELFRALEFKMGPPPPGGLYAYEQQRLLFNPTNEPLVQPFAAFTGGQLITLAIENLVGRYLFNRVTGARQSRTERAVREEVRRTIAEFCAKQPDRARIEICWMGTDR
jgi:hypothetical protein